MKRWVFGFLLFVLMIIMASIAWADGAPVEVYVEVTYGQTEARSMLDMVNDFRTGPDAWYWNKGNEIKTILSNLEPLVYDYDLEKHDNH